MVRKVRGLFAVCSFTGAYAAFCIKCEDKLRPTRLTFPKEPTTARCKLPSSPSKTLPALHSIQVCNEYGGPCFLVGGNFDAEGEDWPGTFL